MCILKVVNSGRFYKLWGIHEGLKSLFFFFGSVKWNKAGLTSCAFPSAGLIGVEELIPSVSLTAWQVLIALWSASPRALAICRRQISRHAERGGAREPRHMFCTRSHVSYAALGYVHMQTYVALYFYVILYTCGQTFTCISNISTLSFYLNPKYMHWLIALGNTIFF